MFTVIMYQASGEVCTYTQKDTEAAALILDRLNPAKIFHEGRVLIGSPLGLSIYSGHQISRIDLIASKTLESLLPDVQPGQSGTVIGDEEWKKEFHEPTLPADNGVNEGEIYTSGIQFSLLGNHSVYARITSELVAPMERINRISRILTLPFIRLSLPPHGVTLLNSAAITRITVQPSFSTLPQDVWLATRIG